MSVGLPVRVGSIFHRRNDNLPRLPVALYMSNFGNLIFWMFFLVLLFTYDFLIVVQTWFLGVWASQYSEENPPSDVNVP